LEIHEEMLAFYGLRNHTRDSDAFDVFNNVAQKFELNLKKLVSVATNDTAMMTGHASRLISLLKQHLRENGFDVDVSCLFPAFYIKKIFMHKWWRKTHRRM
jgi:hypothetical protein